jgi:hypothetical protein
VLHEWRFRLLILYPAVTPNNDFFGRTGFFDSLNGLYYVILRSHARGGRILAIYRIGKNGSLRRLKRWPMEPGR